MMMRRFLANSCGTRLHGVPAPAYLVDDPWFGPAPTYTDKQKDYMAIEAEYKEQEQASSPSVESGASSEMMCQIATRTGSPTTLQLDPPGGSENFHEGPGGWHSGTGYNHFAETEDEQRTYRRT